MAVFQSSASPLPEDAAAEDPMELFPDTEAQTTTEDDLDLDLDLSGDQLEDADDDEMKEGLDIEVDQVADREIDLQTDENMLEDTADTEDILVDVAEDDRSEPIKDFKQIGATLEGNVADAEIDDSEQNLEYLRDEASVSTPTRPSQVAGISWEQEAQDSNHDQQPDSHELSAGLDVEGNEGEFQQGQIKVHFPYDQLQELNQGKDTLSNDLTFQPNEHMEFAHGKLQLNQPDPVTREIDDEQDGQPKARLGHNVDSPSEDAKTSTAYSVRQEQAENWSRSRDVPNVEGVFNQNGLSGQEDDQNGSPKPFQHNDSDARTESDKGQELRSDNEISPEIKVFPEEQVVQRIEDYGLSRASQSGHVHPVIVDYQEDEIWLFPPHEEEQHDSQTYFLQDENIALDSIKSLLDECRKVLEGSIGEQEDLEFVIEDLGLRIGESRTEASTITLAQIIDVHLRLHYNEGTENPPPMKMRLCAHMHFSRRFQHLLRMAGDGKGISQIDYSESHEAESEQSVPSDDTPLAEGSGQTKSIGGEDGKTLRDFDEGIDHLSYRSTADAMDPSNVQIRSEYQRNTSSIPAGKVDETDQAIIPSKGTASEDEIPVTALTQTSEEKDYPLDDAMVSQLRTNENVDRKSVDYEDINQAPEDSSVDSSTVQGDEIRNAKQSVVATKNQHVMDNDVVLQNHPAEEKSSEELENEDTITYSSDEDVDGQNIENHMPPRYQEFKALFADSQSLQSPEDAALKAANDSHSKDIQDGHSQDSRDFPTSDEFAENQGSTRTHHYSHEEQAPPYHRLSGQRETTNIASENDGHREDHRQLVNNYHNQTDIDNGSPTQDRNNSKIHMQSDIVTKAAYAVADDNEINFDDDEQYEIEDELEDQEDYENGDEPADDSSDLDTQISVEKTSAPSLNLLKRSRPSYEVADISDATDVDVKRIRSE